MQMEATGTHVLRGKASLLLTLSIFFALAAARFASAEVHYHDFVIKAKKETRLCKTKSIITVNGMFPGPTLEVRNGDTLVIKAINRARYNITLHWHGVRQLRTAWADGPEYVTQCPIQPGGSYTYRFTIQDQEGTLWWHAHASWLRATVYGALVIRPKLGSTYPFPQPKREIPILLGDWWKANPIDVVNQAARTGAAPRVSDAFTINGQPGDLYNCSSQGTTIIQVNAGESNLLRIINAALNQELFFSIAGHSVTVVAADASYTKPFTTNILMIAPGQTTDVLINTNQAPGRYYMAAHAFNTARGAPFDNTTTTAILQYNSAASSLRPAFPTLPAFNDTRTAAAFGSSIKSPRPIQVPEVIDDNLFITVGLGNFDCPRGQRCRGPNGKRFTASMNNVSFVLPRNLSILQAAQFGVPGVFTTDFPSFPPRVFDFTARNISRSLYQPVNGTRVYRLKYGSRVQVVFQGTNILFGEEHPMHIHGYRFYVLATGSGNFNPSRDTAKFNLVDPPSRNTIGVPVRGWAAIRFVADNPGVWLVHCHLDVHITWGLAMAFLVENGVGESQSLQPPPGDLPKC